MAVILAAALAAWLSSVTVRAETADEQAEDDPDKTRATFVVNFIKYTQWPDERFKAPESPVVVSAVATEQFTNVLRALTLGEKVHADRNIVVQRVTPPPDDLTGEAAEKAWNAFEAQLHDSHVVYVGAAYRELAQRIAGCVEGCALTVGDTADFARSGLMLGLNEENSRIVIYANRKLIEGAQFTLSSRVLRLARVVDDEPR